MNSNQPKLDPMTLQRLIDGELDTQQVQEILSQAQASPDHWKSIAVGFIENQTWEMALSSKFAQPTQVAAQAAQPSPGSNTTLNSRVEESEARISSSSNSSDRATYNEELQQRSAVGWWAIAASLLAAAAIGYMANQIQNRNLPGDSIVENQTSLDPEISDKPKLTEVGLTPDFHVEMPPEAGFGRLDEQNSNGRVPVYRVTNADQLEQFQAQRAIESAFPRRIVEQLSSSGYQIEQEIEFVSGQVDDQSFVVPLRTIRLIPGQ